MSLLLPEDMTAFRRQPAENMLLAFDGQHGDAVLFSITAGAEEDTHTLAPGEGRVFHQFFGISQNPGLLKIEGFHHKILLGGEKRIEEAAGDSHLLINLLYRCMLDALFGHQFHSYGHQFLPQPLFFFQGIGHPGHGVGE